MIPKEAIFLTATQLQDDMTLTIKHDNGVMTLSNSINFLSKSRVNKIKKVLLNLEITETEISYDK